MRIQIAFCLSLFGLFSPSANVSVKAQSVWIDDFSGSAVTSQNSWQGDITQFQITTGQLQLNAPTGGTSTLTLPYQATDSLLFSAWFKLDFAPSSTNLLQYWLLATDPNLALADGYYLEIGENGSNDAIHLKKRIAGQAITLASGQGAAVANQPAQARFSVLQRSSGEWTLSADYTGGNFLTTEFTVNDTEIPIAGIRYAGLYCLYSETRKDKYFFDDISLIRIQPDKTPPTGVSVEIQNATQVKFNLNEPVQLTGTVRADVFPPFQNTPNISLVSGENAVIATFNTGLISGNNYTFRLLSLADTSGNLADTLEFTAFYLVYEQAVPGDILINEIFPDPSPSVGLPTDEFVELYNRSNKYIRGETLQWRDGTSQPVTLSGLTLAPGQIHVLCAQSAVGNFPQGIQITGISPFPTLNNDGETLTLLNQSGQVIDEISYDLSWYVDANKKDGGWTIERINPTLPCSDASNWKASVHPLGGTPGALNSVLDNTPDIQTPTLSNATLTGSRQLLVTTSEILDVASASEPTNWQINPTSLQINNVAQGSTGNSWLLTFSTDVPANVLFLLTAFDVSDCSGNEITGAGLPFARTESPQPKDVVVNEILFNPATGGSRFVELHNQSNKFISLSGCRLVGGPIGDVKVFSLSTTPDLFPDSLVAYTPEKTDILTRFNPPYPNVILENSLPTLPDDEGILLLECFSSGSLQVIDSVRYTKEWHSPFLSSTDLEGVSLERIGRGIDSNLPQTWASSAHTTGGTPGYRNSQYYAQPATGGADQFLTLTQQRLSPDGDGYEDYLPMVFKAEKPGYIGTVQIFNSDGNLINRIANATLLGAETIFRWDGDNAEGEIQRPGIYLLFFEFVSPEGQKHRGKKAVTLLAKF